MIPERLAPTWRWAGFPLSVILLAPSMWWAIHDQGVWSWDPASYAEHALALHLALVSGPAGWLALIPRVSGPHAPGVEWLGQLVLFARPAVGSVEQTLLLQTLLVQACSLGLLWASLWTLSGGRRLPALAGVVTLAAAPLFVGLSTKFMVEPLQTLAVTGFLFTAVHARCWRRLSAVSALLLWTSVALLAKVSSPMYAVMPGAVTAWWCLRPGPVTGHQPVRVRTWIAFALAAGLLVVVLAWYRANLAGVLAFARTASTSGVAELYGRRAPFPEKVWRWLGAAELGFAPWRTWLLLPIAAAGSRLFLGSQAGAGTGTPSAALRVGAALAALQTALVLAIVSLNVNEDPRFIYALGPCLAVVAAWLAALDRTRKLAAVALLLLACQYAAVQATALGWRRGSLPWVEPVETSRQRREALAALVAATAGPGSNQRVVFIAAELPWLNHSSYRFEARKAFARSGIMPAPEGFGYDLRDAAAAYRDILGERPVVVVSYCDPSEVQLATPFNRNTLELAERFRRSAAFTEEGLAADPRIRIFRAVAIPRTGASGDP